MEKMLKSVRLIGLTIYCAIIGPIVLKVGGIVESGKGGKILKAVTMVLAYPVGLFLVYFVKDDLIPRMKKKN